MDESEFANEGALHAAIDAAGGQYDLFRLLKEIATMSAFSHFSVMKLPDEDSDTLEQLSVVSNWPPELMKEYDRHKLLEHSPVIKSLRTSNKPLVWELEKINADRDPSQRSIAIELFSAFDFLSGVYFPCSASTGTRGAVSFAGSGKDPLGEKQIASLALTASLIFDRLIQFESDFADNHVDLSERELQCLRLMATGLATGRIASELEISEHTVNHHISVLIQKLRARNRAHAVSLGFRLKILR
ncbi:MAG: LuxR family transcriptional regulator [Ahrensia sp.]